MIGANQCQHGQLARVCELCERDAEIAQLRQYLDAAQRRGEELRAQVAALEGDAGRYRQWRDVYTGQGPYDLLSALADAWDTEQVDAAPAVPLTDEQFNAMFEQAVIECQGGMGSVLERFGRLVLSSAPAVREPLTDEQIRKIGQSLPVEHRFHSQMFARAIEQAHGIGGGK